MFCRVRKSKHASTVIIKIIHQLTVSLYIKLRQTELSHYAIFSVNAEAVSTNIWNMQLNWNGSKNKSKIRLHGSVVLNLQLTEQSLLRKNMDTALSLLLILKNLIPPTLLR